MPIVLLYNDEGKDINANIENKMPAKSFSRYKKKNILQIKFTKLILNVDKSL